MISVPITAIPNQSLSIQLSGLQFDLRIHDCGSPVMTIDVTVNSEIILTGIRMVPNYPILPAFYELGNFILQTINNEYPDYTQFGITQYLIYATQDEIDAIYAATN